MLYSVSNVKKNMNTGDLSQLRSMIDGCELVLLSDISTKTVLAWDGDLRFPQEHIDSFCDLAASVFAMIAIKERSLPEFAVLTKPTGTRVFVRSIDNPCEVICAVLSRSGDVSVAKDACQAFFDPDRLNRPDMVH